MISFIEYDAFLLIKLTVYKVVKRYQLHLDSAILEIKPYNTHISMHEKLLWCSSCYYAVLPELMCFYQSLTYARLLRSLNRKTGSKMYFSIIRLYNWGWRCIPKRLLWSWGPFYRHFPAITPPVSVNVPSSGITAIIETADVLCTSLTQTTSSKQWSEPPAGLRGLGCQ